MAQNKRPEPHIIPLPEEYKESFDATQAQRGNTTWKTLFSTELAAGIAICPARSKTSCLSSNTGRQGAGYLAKHQHTQAEIYHVLSGRGTVEIEGVEYNLIPGTTVFIPGNAQHGVWNDGDEELKWLYVFPGKFEDVEYRFRHEVATGYGLPKL